MKDKNIYRLREEIESIIYESICDEDGIVINLKTCSKPILSLFQEEIKDLEEQLQSMSEVAEANFQDYIKERNKVIGLDLCRICCGNLDVRLEAKEKQFKEMVEGMKNKCEYCDKVLTMRRTRVCIGDDKIHCICSSERISTQELMYNQALQDVLNKLKE